MPRLLPVLLLLLGACIGAAADHERLGDTAYEQGEFATALEEYRAAARSKDEARTLAKLGAAALKVGDFREAADAYLRLAQADRTRVSEAARGLELVARGATRADLGPALQAAVEGLRRLSPERVNPRNTMALMRNGHLEPPDVVGIGPLALAAAGDAAGVDQMLVAYGGALQSTTACADAADVYLTLLRRSRDAALRGRAIEGLGACGAQLGEEALLVGHPDIAVQWFVRVVRVDSTSPRGRRAFVGLGDARLAQGDLLGATIAYETAQRGGARDSIGDVATQRLERLGARAASSDSTP
jgi:tetratricopeptide (TPR) repeat protein